MKKLLHILNGILLISLSLTSGFSFIKQSCKSICYKDVEGNIDATFSCISQDRFVCPPELFFSLQGIITIGLSLILSTITFLLAKRNKTKVAILGICILITIQISLITFYKRIYPESGFQTQTTYKEVYMRENKDGSITMCGENPC